MRANLSRSVCRQVGSPVSGFVRHNLTVSFDFDEFDIFVLLKKLKHRLNQISMLGRVPFCSHPPVFLPFVRVFQAAINRVLAVRVHLRIGDFQAAQMLRDLENSKEFSPLIGLLAVNFAAKHQRQGAMVLKQRADSIPSDAALFFALIFAASVRKVLIWKVRAIEICLRQRCRLRRILRSWAVNCRGAGAVHHLREGFLPAGNSDAVFVP